MATQKGFVSSKNVQKKNGKTLPSLRNPDVQQLEQIESEPKANNVCKFKDLPYFIISQTRISHGRKAGNTASPRSVEKSMGTLHDRRGRYRHIIPCVLIY